MAWTDNHLRLEIWDILRMIGELHRLLPQNLQHRHLSRSPVYANCPRYHL